MEGGTRQLGLGIGALLGFGLLGYVAEWALESVKGREFSIWTKLTISATFFWVFLAFLWWAHAAASRRPHFPTLAEFLDAPTGLWDLVTSGEHALAHAARVLEEEFQRRGIGPSQTQLYIKGTRFWATLAVLLILSAITGIVQFLLERNTLGVLGNIVPILLLLFYLEWVNLCAIGNFQPLYTAHFDEQNLLSTHPPDRREIPTSMFDPPTPKGSPELPSSDDEAAESNSAVFGPKEKTPGGRKTCILETTTLTETPERRRQREEFERLRLSHYDMSHVFKKLNLDDIPDNDEGKPTATATQTQTTQTFPVPVASNKQSKSTQSQTSSPEKKVVHGVVDDESEWEKLTMEDVRKQEEARNTPEGQKEHQEFERKRLAHYHNERKALQKNDDEDDEDEKKKPAKKGSAIEIQFGNNAGSEEPPRKTGGGSPKSGEGKQKTGKGGSKHPSFEEPKHVAGSVGSEKPSTSTKSPMSSPGKKGVHGVVDDESEWKKVTMEDVRKQEEARDTPEGQKKREEFERKRNAHYLKDREALLKKKEEDEDEKKKPAKKGSAIEIQFGNNAGSEEPPRKTGGGSPKSGEEKQKTAKGGSKHPSFEEPKHVAGAAGSQKTSTSTKSPTSSPGKKVVHGVLDDESEWKKVTMEDVRKQEEARDTPEGQKKREEFERKRNAHYLAERKALLKKNEEDEEEKKEPAKKGSAIEIQFGDNAGSEEPPRKTGGGSPSSGEEKQKTAEGGSKHPSFVEPQQVAGAGGSLSHAEFLAKRTAMEAESGKAHRDELEKQRREEGVRRGLAEEERGDWVSEGGTGEKTTREERELLITSHELLSAHFLESLGEETLLPESGSPLLLLRYLKHQIRMAAATADVLDEEMAARQSASSSHSPHSSPS